MVQKNSKNRPVRTHDTVVEFEKFDVQPSEFSGHEWETVKPVHITSLRLPKQRMFMQYYHDTDSYTFGNKFQSGIRAGYSKSTMNKNAAKYHKTIMKQIMANFPEDFK